MTTVPEESITNIINEIANALKLTEWRYTHQKFEAIAQNYFGIIIPLILNGKDNRTDVSIKLVLKLAPNDDRYRVSGAVTLMFAREIFVYSVILKKYQEFQQNFSLQSKYVIPDCYYVCKEYCKEAIAMQNMCEDDYSPFTKERFLNLEHVTIALKSLAKLHALSFILREKDAKVYEEVSKVCLPLSERVNKRYIDITIDRLSKALEQFKHTEYVPLLESLKKHCGKCFDMAVESVHATCICHGDIWKENILFKYKDDTPISACLIDYQTTRISSPAFDTLYLIISSTNTELRQKYYHQLLDIYHQTFDQILKEANLESQTLYSRETFGHDLKVVWPACFITANTALWLSSGLQEEGHVRSKHIWSTREEKKRAVNQYKEIIKAIIDDFHTYGYLSLKSNEYFFPNCLC